MFYLIAALMMWSSSFVAAKYVYTMLDPAWMVQGRLMIAAAIALPFCRRHLGRVPKNRWRSLLCLSFLNYVAVLMLQFLGVKYTSAASAVTIVGLEPLLMVLVGQVFFGDRAQWHHWLCGAAAFVGVAVLIAGGAHVTGEHSISLFGCLLVLLAGLLFCLIMRPTQQLIADIGAPAYTALSLMLSVPMCLPFALLLADSHTVHWSWTGSLGLLYLGVGCSWLAYWLWNRGIGRVSANLSGLLLALEPVFGVLLAVWLLGETISPLSWAGIVLVLSATLTAGLWPRLRPDKAA